MCPYPRCWPFPKNIWDKCWFWLYVPYVGPLVIYDKACSEQWTPESRVSQWNCTWSSTTHAILGSKSLLKEGENLHVDLPQLSHVKRKGPSFFYILTSHCSFSFKLKVARLGLKLCEANMLTLIQISHHVVDVFDQLDELRVINFVRT